MLHLCILGANTKPSARQTLYGTRIGHWIKTRSTSDSEFDIPYGLLNPEDCESDVALLGDVMADGDSASDTRRVEVLAELIEHNKLHSPRAHGCFIYFLQPCKYL